MASAMGYVAGEVGKDVVSGYRVVRDTATKTSVNTQLAYTDLVGKSVNGAREYMRITAKTIGEQKKEVVLTNAIVAGAVKSGFESYGYIINGKPMTHENLSKSIKEIGYSFSMGGATTGMPILPVIGLGATVDWAKDGGNYEVKKSTGSAVIGSISDNYFRDSITSPIIREIMTNSFEKFYDAYNKEESNEKK